MVLTHLHSNADNTRSYSIIEHPQFWSLKNSDPVHFSTTSEDFRKSASVDGEVSIEEDPDYNLASAIPP